MLGGGTCCFDLSLFRTRIFSNFNAKFSILYRNISLVPGVLMLYGRYKHVEDDEKIISGKHRNRFQFKMADLQICHII